MNKLENNQLGDSLYPLHEAAHEAARITGLVGKKAEIEDYEQASAIMDYRRTEEYAREITMSLIHFKGGLNLETFANQWQQFLAENPDKDTIFEDWNSIQTYLENILDSQITQWQGRLALLNHSELYKDKSGNLTTQKTEKKLSYEENKKRSSETLEKLKSLGKVKSTLRDFIFAGSACFQNQDILEAKDLPSLFNSVVSTCKENLKILEQRLKKLKQYGQESLNTAGLTEQEAEIKIKEWEKARKEEADEETKKKINLNIQVRPALEKDRFDGNALFVETTSPHQPRLTWQFAPERLPDDALPIWTTISLAFGTKSPAGAIETLKYMAKKLYGGIVKIDLPGGKIFTTDPGPWLGREAVNVKNLGKLLGRRINIVKMISVKEEKDYCWKKSPSSLKLEWEETVSYIPENNDDAIVPGHREIKSTSAGYKKTGKVVQDEIFRIVNGLNLNEDGKMKLLEEAENVLNFKFDFEKKL